MSVRLRQLAPIVLVLGLTVGGFFVSRAHGEQDARRDSAHRAEIAATEVRDRVTQAATLVDGVRRFLTGDISPGVTTERFGDIGTRWLGPVGVPAAAWVQRVSDYERPGYERQTGHRIVEPTQSGGVRPPGPRESYLPATLVTGIPPMSVPGIDLSGASGVAAAVARPQTAYRVTATSLGKLPDGTAGLFLVQSAQRLENGGIVEPGFVVLFVPASWLLAAAAESNAPNPTSNPKLKLTVGSRSTGTLRGAEEGSAFTALGQRFDLEVPVEKVRGNAAVLPWIILVGGLVLAALVGALAVISGRRAKAKAEVDRLSAISPDMIVVAGFDGYFKRVNPAFEALLGYTEQEALARPYIEFVHPDDRERTTAEAGRLEEGQTTTSFDNRYVCKNGSHRWIEWTATPVVEEKLIYAVARDVTERRQAETNLREAEERNRALAEEQAALRRVATLVARRLPPEDVFAAVAQEVGQLLPVSSAVMGRYDPDGMFTIVAVWSTGATTFPVGNRWTPEGKNVTTMVLETGGSARLDSFADASGPVGVAAREAGYRSAVGTPITVEGRLWGVMIAASTAEEPLPPATETRLVSFTELVATAIANAESRAGLARLAEQQAALRRVATLVAEGVPPAEVFSALCDEVNQLLDAQTSTIVRLEADGMTTVVASGGEITEELEVGTRTKPAPGMVVLPIIETGRPARKEDYDDSSGRPAGVARGLRVARALGLRSTVGVPIVVEGALWGVFIIGTGREHFADDTEQRLEEFTELAATAIANSESRSEIARLAEDQASLRRVATLVAEGVSPAEVFSTLCDEVNRLLDAETTAIQRLEADGTVTIVASAGAIADQLGAGTCLTPQPGWVLTTTLETGRPARKEDYVQATGSIPAIIRDVGIRSSVGAPIFVEGELWGVIIVGTVREHFPAETEDRLERFTEVLATAIANAEAREARGRLAEQQAALHRVATLVAEGAEPQELFDVMAEEVGRVVDVQATSVVRYELDGTATELANYNRGQPKGLFPVGVRMNIEGKNILQMVRDSSAAARIDDYSQAYGEMAEIVRSTGIHSTVGVPVIAAGRVWGAMVGSKSEPGPLPPETASRMTDFTELLATAIENTESREALERLAEEQAALRRVATLVARGVSPAEVFSAVAEEVERLLDAEATAIARLEPDATMTLVASGGTARRALPVGTRLEVDSDTAIGRVLRSGRSARVDDFSTAPERTAERAGLLGIRCSVAVPIIVEGALWGSIGAGTDREQFSADAEQRMAAFTELAGTAIANAHSRDELSASRRRIVAASDEARRRIERDLHDGTQQRLVTLALALRRTEDDVSADKGDLGADLSQIATELDRAIEELRELSRGIHPVILSERGLGAALRALARRSAIPVELDIAEARLPESLEVAAYFVASEALANATKHSYASQVEVSLLPRGGSLLMSICDDGVGGAELDRGSGLVGLQDRVEALGGTIEIESPAGEGTSLVVTLPFEGKPDEPAAIEERTGAG